MMSMRSSVSDYQGFAGPGDRDLPRSEISGYQPPNRIGEIVQNAFVDTYEWSALRESLMAKDMTPAYQLPGLTTAQLSTVVEHRPMFYEWATVQPGMICVARKKKTYHFRQYVAAETASPVIVCAACLSAAQEKDFYFAGVARSQMVRPPDDGTGPSVDEFFTVSLGGIQTLLNTSGTDIYPGDLVEWCFVPNAVSAKRKRDSGPRRVACKTASPTSSKIIGKALSLARPGEPLDIHLKQ